MIQKHLLFLFLGCNWLLEAKTVYFTPGLWVDLFDVASPILNGDKQREPMHKLKFQLEQLGYRVKQTDTLDNLEDFFCLITFDIPLTSIFKIADYPKDRCFAFLWEPPTVMPTNYNKLFHSLFKRVYTWHDDLVDTTKYFKFYYPVCHPMPQAIVPFEQKKLCTMISCNKNSSHPDELYTARRSVIEYYENLHPQEFDLYGKAWPRQLRTFKGPVLQKVEFMRRYKFSFCYENIKNVPGYITEKIFDSFQAGCVPIYWGASNVTDYIPKNCFINRAHFQSEDQLYHYIKNMSEQAYQDYIENIWNFLQSPQAELYTSHHFISLVLDLVLTVEQEHE